MSEQYLILCVLLVAPIVCGISSALWCKSKRALVLAPAVSWLAFLAVNLYSERTAPDRELMQGSWLFFQVTIGSFVALVSTAAAGATLKARRPVP